MVATIIRPREHKAKKNKTMMLGDKVANDGTHNCLTCQRWSVCKDPSKAFLYRCSRFVESSIDGSTMEDTANIHSFFGLSEDAEVLYKPELGTDEEKRLDEIIADAIAENSPIPPDIKINDAHIPTANNFHQWLTDERFAGGGMPPFPRQIYVGAMLFSDWCPRCSDADWFETMKVDVPLSKIEAKVTFLQRGVCPRCKVGRDELVEDGELDNYNELTMICGQRSAKTSTINLLDGYNIHRYLKLSSPTKVYRQLPQQVFTITYTSSTFGQVKANMWEPFLNLLSTSNWFQNYHKFIAKRGQELGEELANVSEIYVRYRHRNLFISPASPSGRTMRGRTRITAAIDEISHMPLQRASGKEAVMANAKDTYAALKNSLITVQSAYRTRFGEGYFDLPKAVMYNASSPLTLNDYGMTLYRASRLSNEMLGLKYPTWKFNPTLPKSSFANMMKTHPVEFARDIACEPPIGSSSWMDDVETVAKAFGKKRNMYDIEHYTFRSKSKKKMTSAHLRKRSDPELEWGCILAIDVGSVNNSFAFAVGTVPNDFDLQSYIANMSDPEDDTPLDDDADPSVGLVPLRVIFAGEIIPRKEAEISQTAMYRDVFATLCRDLPIQLVISDRWQNKKLVQDMEEEFHCEYYEYKLEWEDFENFKEAMFSNDVKLPKMKMEMNELVATTLDNYPHMFEGKPIDHLAYQFLTVQEARGNTVVKGDATDDMFRTVALLHAALQDKEMLEDLLTTDDYAAPKPALGLVRHGTQGIGQSITGQTAALTPRGQSAPVAFIGRGKR